MRQPKVASAWPAQPDAGSKAASKVVVDRRAMLVGLPALGLGMGEVIRTGGGDASEGGFVKTDSRRLNYRENEHIRTYYALARR